MGRKPATDRDAALTPLMFQILVALTAGPCHGYGILQEIEERTGGAFKVGAGSMYRSIRQLEDAGLVAETEPDERVHSQRRYYRLTDEGRRRASAEARVLDDVVAWAREARLIDTGRR